MAVLAAQARGAAASGRSPARARLRLRAVGCERLQCAVLRREAGVHRHAVIRAVSRGRLLDGSAAVRGAIRQSAAVALAVRHLAQCLVSRLDRWPPDQRYRPPARPLQTLVRADPADKHYATGPAAKESPAG